MKRRKRGSYRGIKNSKDKWEINDKKVYLILNILIIIMNVNELNIKFKKINIIIQLNVIKVMLRERSQIYKNI